MKVFLLTVCCLLAAASVHGEIPELMEALRGVDSADGKADAARAVLVEALASRKADEGISELHEYLKNQASETKKWDDPAVIEKLIPATCCAVSLDVFRHCDIPTEVWKWLFVSDARVRLITETLTDKDNAVAASRIIQKLYEHDPAERDRFFDLILALAVVWDTPRKAMHEQIGNSWRKPDNNICVYYDYFKKLYESGTAEVHYDELSVGDLVFVVDVPAPVSELKWVLANVEGTRSEWGEKYDEIQYDITRLVKGQYFWPHREYLLREIKDCHGICVDQAYYAVMTARAYGIPAIYFHGVGKFGGHAWFGFMKSKNQWDMDIGRYSKQGYAAGYAIHPQTDKEMTDHELAYLCSRALRSETVQNARVLALLAEILCEKNAVRDALQCARQAVELDPLCESAWEVELDVLLKEKKLDQAILLLDLKADKFSAYPDIAAEVRQKQAALMATCGDAAGAGRLLAGEVAMVDRDRDDLKCALVIAQARQLQKQGDVREALGVLEKALRQQRRNGAKLFPLLEAYFSLAKETGQTRDMRDFVDSYRADFEENMDFRSRARLTKILNDF